MGSSEIDEGTDYVGYKEAFHLIASNVQPVGVEAMLLGSCVGRVASEDLIARVSYPSGDISLKDGFAVRSKSVATASVERPACL
jgi:molybdopterin biosynthesis enzyme